jgi:hypothetical protein
MQAKSGENGKSAAETIPCGQQPTRRNPATGLWGRVESLPITHEFTAKHARNDRFQANSAALVAVFMVTVDYCYNPAIQHRTSGKPCKPSSE